MGIDSQIKVIWASDPILPGESGLLRGVGFHDTAYIEVSRVQDGDPGRPRYALQSSPSGVPRDVIALEAPSEFVWPEQGIVQVDPIQLQDCSVKFVLPEQARHGVFALRVVLEDGTHGPSVLLNRPQIWWCQSDRGRFAVVGESLRVFGKNLCAGGEPTIVLASANDRKQELWLQAEMIDDYSVMVSLPPDLDCGEYVIYAHNGYGGSLGWAMPSRITVQEAEAWPEKLYDVRDFGAEGSGKADDTDAVRAALSEALKSGGGIVYFPRGTYLVSDTLEVPRFTTLKGESRSLSSIVLQDFPLDQEPPSSVIRGTNHFAVEDLTIYARRHRYIILSDQVESGAGQVFVRRVTVIANTFRKRLSYEEADQRYRDLRWGPELRNTTSLLVLGGEGVVVEDCELTSSAGTIAISGGKGVTVARNRLRAGRGGYSISGSDGLVFEENHIIGGDLQSGGSGLSWGNEHVYFSGNRLEDIFGCEREAMTTDGGGGAYTGPIDEAGESFVSRSAGLEPYKLKEGWGKLGVYVLSGRGAGQVRQIVRYDEDRIEIDTPWEIVPDNGSVISVTAIRRNMLFHDNEFINTGHFQFYGTAVDVIVSRCRTTRSGGFYNRGQKTGHVYQPSWYVLWIENEILEGYYSHWGGDGDNWSGPARMATHASAPVDHLVVIGTIFRRNHIHNNGCFIVNGQPGWGYFSRQKPVVEDVILDSNTVEHSDIGIEVGNGVTRLLVRRNECVDVKDPVVFRDDVDRSLQDIQIC